MSEQRENVDGVAEIAGVDGDDALESSRTKRRRRSPLVSVIVIVLGTYLLITMSADARYWTRGETPRQLGDAATFVESGGLAQEHSDEYVVVEGTPDVRTAARYKIGERRVQLLRITEGGGSLFAAVPRAEGARSDEYAGRYEGRMRRLSSSSMLPWIQQFYADLRITESLEISPQGFADGLAAGQVQTTKGVQLRLTPKTRVSLSVKIPDVRLQLGRNSFRRRADARAAIEALGVPFYEPEEQGNAKFYQFWARIPQAARADARARLSEGLGEVGVAKASEGVAILPGSATFWVAVADLRVEDGAFVFPERDGMPKSLFELAGERLVPIKSDGQIRLSIADAVRSAAIDRPVTVDPHGYIINVGERPADHPIAPLLWFVALIVVMLNVVSVALHLRK
jgi:hypothetical protein